MTYFGFLVGFLIFPLGVLSIWHDRSRGKPPWGTILATALIALVYTTPWDNYLVSSGVWWYDPSLVSGLTLGWVPIEEYLFFVLQPLLVGVWLAFIPRGHPGEALPASPSRSRLAGLGLATVLWISGLTLLLSGWAPGRYLGLELAWGIPPLMLQLAFGADMLWQDRRRIGQAIVPAVVYLCAADAIALSFGTWTISPAFSLGIRVAGVLPIEEFTFFVLTCSLIVFTVVLLQSSQAKVRMANFLTSIESRRRPIRFE